VASLVKRRRKNPPGDDIIQKILDERPGPKPKRVVGGSGRGFVRSKISKRLIVNGKYVIDVKVDGLHRLVPWSSKPAVTRKNIKKAKTILKELAIEAKKTEKRKIPKHHWMLEKIRADNGEIFYLKYKKNIQRNNIINKLQYRYGFNDFKTLKLESNIYAKFLFGEMPK
jgi:hypothetical protein